MHLVFEPIFNHEKNKIMSNKNLIYIIIIGLAVTGIGCKKFLDAKPDKRLAVPSTLNDLQSLMDNYPVFADEPSAREMSSDDYYLTTANWTSLAYESDRRIYTWEKDYLFEPISNSWSYFSNAVYYCNSVMEGLDKIERTAQNRTVWDNIKGQALYFRGKRFLQASFIWTLAYDHQSAKTDLGLPLRLTSDFNQKSVRSTVEQTFGQIISDIKSSIPLLPIKPLSPVRASRPAAYALLARTYLSMRDYINAGIYADSCLQLNKELIDYNSLSTSATYPLARFNKEVLSENQMSTGQALNRTRGMISPDLYNLYEKDDLRKEVLFINNVDGTHGFKGRFAEGDALFGGMGTNEVYLILAECLIREGKTDEGLAVLNSLLEKRWRVNEFNPISGLDQQEALIMVLKERRKDLLFRGIRWMDIKRLNKEGANIVLTRNLNNKIYTLLPNDLRYALPIPEDVIAISGMQQNLRN